MTSNNQKFIAATLAFAPFLLLADAAVMNEHEGEIAQIKTQTIQENPTKTARTTPFIEYSNRMVVFSSFHQAYERIKPHNLYVGIEAYITPIFGLRHVGYVAEAEFRMGYNFFWNGRDHFAPIVGIGGLSVLDYQHQHRRCTTGILYGALGFLYDHEFNSVFNLGVNLKGIIGGKTNRHSSRHRWGSGAVGGFDVAVPITFRFGRNRHWDFRLEPFNLFLANSKTIHNTWGFRNTLGYRF